MGELALVRAPFTYRYNRTDVREDVILSQLSNFLTATYVDHDIFDFHLDRKLHAADIVRSDPSAVVIAVRETGDNIHYAIRLARYLKQHVRVPVVLYGQTARLERHRALPDGVPVVRHDEAELGRVLGLRREGPRFGDSLGLTPYFDRIDLEPWQTSRFRGSIETTRGCPYPCDFCFINAGNNHSRRWQRQSLERTLDSLGAYFDRGIDTFVFHDSELIGGAPGDLAATSNLIDAIVADLPPIYFKAYARADTLLKYGKFDRLREAGLVSVFMGVESFVQADLDTLQKRLDVADVMAAIDRLTDHGIHADLSFILFNRRTTAASLRENLNHIHRLYSSDHARLLGMPHFSFSFESVWKAPSAAMQALSGQTYVSWDVGIKSPPASGTAFDAELEPLMEIYRLLAYEWSRKVVDLSLARDEASPQECDQIEDWFSNLGRFCSGVMLGWLDAFESGRLTLASLPASRDKLFDEIASYHARLPARMQHPATFETHAGEIGYQAETDILEPDEYWLDHIPDVDVAGSMSSDSPMTAPVQDISAFYDEAAALYALVAEDRDFAAQAEFLWRHVAGERNGARFLELFAGPARHAVELRKNHALHPIAIDASPSMKRLATADGGLRPECYIVCQLPHLPPPSDLGGPIDGASILRYSIGYLGPEALGRTLQGLSGLLRTGGRVILELHDLAQVRSDFRDLEIKDRIIATGPDQAIRCVWPEGRLMWRDDDWVTEMTVLLQRLDHGVVVQEHRFVSVERIYSRVEVANLASLAAGLREIEIPSGDIPFPGSVLLLLENS